MWSGINDISIDNCPYSSHLYTCCVLPMTKSNETASSSFFATVIAFKKLFGTSTGRFLGVAFHRDIRLVKLKMQIRFLSHCNHKLLERSVSVWMHFHNLVVPSLSGVRDRPGKKISSNVVAATFTLLFKKSGRPHSDISQEELWMQIGSSRIVFIRSSATKAGVRTRRLTSRWKNSRVHRTTGWQDFSGCLWRDRVRVHLLQEPPLSDAWTCNHHRTKHCAEHGNISCVTSQIHRD